MHNRLPNTQVLLEYLELYTKAREADRKSATSRFQYATQKATSIFTARVPVIDQLSAITNIVISNISNVTTFDQWLELISTLRTEAGNAQRLKTLNDESLLAETLHALADIIISELTSNAQFDALMRQHQQNKEQVAALIKKSINESRGIGIGKLNDEYNKLVYTMAIHGDKESINEALQRKLITALNYPKTEDLFNYGCLPTGNHAVPLCMQVEFAEWLYKKNFQKNITNISFEEFTLRAINKGEQEKLLAEQKKLQPKEGIVRLLDGSEPVSIDAQGHHAADSSIPDDVAEGEPDARLGDVNNPQDLTQHDHTSSSPGGLAANSVFTANRLVASPPQSPRLDSHRETSDESHVATSFTKS